MRNQLHRARRLGVVEIAPPVALPVPGRHGHYRAITLRQKSNAVFLTSRGELTAYSSDGEMLWQVFTGMSWEPAPVDDENGSEVQNSGAPGAKIATLLPLALRKHAIPSALLVAGTDSATIVSEHGHELWSFPLPERPLQPLVAVDFNLDGHTDIVLVSAEGLYAWAQVRKPGAGPFSALVGGLVVIMLAVFVMQQGFMKSSLSGGGSKVKGRSTDRVD